MSDQFKSVLIGLAWGTCVSAILCPILYYVLLPFIFSTHGRCAP